MFIFELQLVIALEMELAFVKDYRSLSPSIDGYTLSNDFKSANTWHKNNHRKSVKKKMLY